MAVLTIVEANFGVISDVSSLRNGAAGENIQAGRLVYLDTTTNKYMMTDVSAAATSKAVGFSVNGASTNEKLFVCSVQSALYSVGSLLTQGEIYVAADDPGKIMLASDLTTGQALILVGYGYDATTLQQNINVTGISIP